MSGLCDLTHSLCLFPGLGGARWAVRSVVGVERDKESSSSSNPEAIAGGRGFYGCMYSS